MLRKIIDNDDGQEYVDSLDTGQELKCLLLTIYGHSWSSYLDCPATGGVPPMVIQSTADTLAESLSRVAKTVRKGPFALLSSSIAGPITWCESVQRALITPGILPLQTGDPLRKLIEEFNVPITDEHTNQVEHHVFCVADLTLLTEFQLDNAVRHSCVQHYRAKRLQEYLQELVPGLKPFCPHNFVPGLGDPLTWV
jgi:hypothetical protein